MSASLVQLSAVGVENVDITVDAQHTFWKSVYSKHTGFAVQPITLQFDENSTSQYYGETHKIGIKRLGDMVTDLWLVIDIANNPLDPGYRFTNDFGRALIEHVKFEIGGVLYDTRFGEYMHINEELSEPNELHLNKLTGKSESLTDLDNWATQPQRLYVPIRFWFTDAYSNALPLVGLYAHDIQLIFTFRPYTDVVITTTAAVDAVQGTNGGELSMSLLAEYVFLENNERNHFARSTHKYMIEQIQHPGEFTIAAGKAMYMLDLTFSHPTSEIIWIFRKASNTAAKEYFNFEGEELAPHDADAFSALQLLLNNAQRWGTRGPLYFRGRQAKRHHSRIPTKQIYTYSFGLFPEKSCAEPSGSINFSRIDFSRMEFTFTSPLTEKLDLFIFARSVNWMKVERGIAKLYYA